MWDKRGFRAVTFHHDAETDSLYIDLSDSPSTESQEVLPGIMLDLDAAGHVCGVDVDHASQNLSGLETYLLSESALAKDWLRPEENEAWQNS